MRTLIIITLLFALVPIALADTMPVFECMPDVPYTVYKWGDYRESIAVIALPDIEAATAIWVGYANGGWDVPGDIHGAYKFRAPGASVWVWYAESAGLYYLFAFDNIIPDAGGGIHPCGYGAITTQQFDEILEGSNGNH